MTADWKNLDRATRRALLRGAPAPTPEIAQIAVHEARAYLARGPFRAAVPLLAVILPAEIVLLTSAAVTGATVPTQALLPIVLVTFWWVARRRLAFNRIINQSVAFVPAPPPAEPASPAASGTVVFPLSLRRLLTTFGLVAALMSALFAFSLAKGDLVYPTITGLAALGSVAALVHLLIHRRRPALVFTPDALHVPSWNLSVPWSDITEIRLAPLRNSRSSPHLTVAFHLSDAPATTAALKGFSGFSARANLRYYATPLAFTDLTLTTPAPEIARAATAYTPAPYLHSTA
ncbi:hypothetical protein GCM10027589_13900 [Actinocorallia lasiicapitis]